MHGVDIFAGKKSCAKKIVIFDRIFRANWDNMRIQDGVLLRLPNIVF